MKRVSDTWASDVPVSYPEPPPMPIQVDFQGFGFTMGGMAFAVSETELEDIFTPTFSPRSYHGERKPDFAGDDDDGR